MHIVIENRIRFRRSGYRIHRDGRTTDKTAGTQGITGCNVRSVILPLLADHVLREANHYLWLLEHMDA
ncbi:MAG: DUF2935 domain-containing protein [Lachnospiraceae bacterium]